MACGSRRRDGTGGAIPSWKLTVSTLPATRHAERPIFSRSRSVVANKLPTGLPRRAQGRAPRRRHSIRQTCDNRRVSTPKAGRSGEQLAVLQADIRSLRRC